MVFKKETLKVAIVGSGTMGTALSHVVASAGHDCTLLTDDQTVANSINTTHCHPVFFQELSLHNRVTASTIFEHSIAQADFIIMAVPSYEMRETAKHIQPFINNEHAILSVTKGFEPVTHKLMSQVLQEEFASDHIGTLSGPNITLDLVKNQPTILVISSPSQQLQEQGALAFSSATVKIILSADMPSYEYISALKNIVALEVGIATGLGLGDNFRAVVLAQGMAEISKLLAAMALDSSAFYGLAGLSDIFLTCCSAFARNYTIGVDLGRGAALSVLIDELKLKGEVAEGIESVKAGHALMTTLGCAMPLLKTTYNFMYQQPRKDSSDCFVSALLI